MLQSTKIQLVLPGEVYIILLSISFLQILFPYNCPNFDFFLSEYEQTAEYKAAEEKYSSLMAHLTAHTGVKYSSFAQLYYIEGVLTLQVWLLKNTVKNPYKV